MKLADCNQSNLQEFYAMCTERYHIYLKRVAGEPAPWTEDPILQSYYFCNVFREDDRTTVWFRENLREPLRDDPFVYTATAAFRAFNRVEPTGEALLEDLLAKEWDPVKVLEKINNLRPPVVTGAYMVPSKPGIPKHDWLVQVVDTIHKDATNLLPRVEPGRTSLEGLWRVLKQYPGVGPFLAYELITDLRHTYLLENAPDIMLWAAPGPGCTRGLGRVAKDAHFYFSDCSEVNWAEMMGIMQEMMAQINNDETPWEATWPRWEMRDVEHCLCEYSKYKVGQEGGRMKRLYKAGVPRSARGAKGKSDKHLSPGLRGSGTII